MEKFGDRDNTAEARARARSAQDEAKGPRDLGVDLLSRMTPNDEALRTLGLSRLHLGRVELLERIRARLVQHA